MTVDFLITTLEILQSCVRRVFASKSLSATFKGPITWCKQYDWASQKSSNCSNIAIWTEKHGPEMPALRGVCLETSTHPSHERIYPSLFSWGCYLPRFHSSNLTMLDSLSSTWPETFPEERVVSSNGSHSRCYNSQPFKSRCSETGRHDIAVALVSIHG